MECRSPRSSPPGARRVPSPARRVYPAAAAAGSLPPRRACLPWPPRHEYVPPDTPFPRFLTGGDRAMVAWWPRSWCSATCPGSPAISTQLPRMPWPGPPAAPAPPTARSGIWEDSFSRAPAPTWVKSSGWTSPRSPRRCRWTPAPAHSERSRGDRQPDYHAGLLGGWEYGRARDEPLDVTPRHRVGDDAGRGVATSRRRLTREPLACCSPIALPACRRRACRLRDTRFRSR
jgi:hypothetical protein